MIIAKFRDRYPQGSLIGKLVEIDRGTYIVRVSVKVDNIILATALAGAETVELAEDAARERAIATLFLNSQTDVPRPQPKVANPAAITQPQEILAKSNLASDSTVNNMAIASPEMTQQNNVSYLSTAPTVIPDPPTPKPAQVPIVEDSEPVTNTGNLFAGTFPSEATQPIFPEDAPAEEIVSSENVVQKDLEVAKSEITAMETADFNFNEVKQKTDIEIERLGWTRDDGREFLQSRYGKRSRLHLKDKELLEFLHYLEQQPTPVN